MKGSACERGPKKNFHLLNADLTVKSKCLIVLPIILIFNDITCD